MSKKNLPSERKAGAGLRGGSKKEGAEIDDKFVLSMLATLNACIYAVDMNGPAEYMLAEEFAEIGKPFEDLTLGEVIAALGRVDVRYHRMADRLRAVLIEPSEVMTFPVLNHS